MRNINYKQDGNKICATYDTFENLAVSPAGFGDTEEQAKKELLKETAQVLTIRLNDKQSDNLHKAKTSLRLNTNTSVIHELITRYVINNNLTDNTDSSSFGIVHNQGGFKVYLKANSDSDIFEDEHNEAFFDK